MEIEIYTRMTEFPNGLLTFPNVLAEVERGEGKRDRVGECINKHRYAHEMLIRVDVPQPVQYLYLCLSSETRERVTAETRVETVIAQYKINMEMDSGRSLQSVISTVRMNHPPP